MKALRLMLVMASLSGLALVPQVQAVSQQDSETAKQRHSMQSEHRQPKHRHSAQQEAGQKRQRGHNMMQQLASLDLTDEQKQQIRQLMQQNRAERKAKYAGKEPAAGQAPSVWQDPSVRQELNALMQAEQFDELAVQQWLEQQQPAQLQRRLQALKLQHQLRQILTEEQRQQLQAIRKSRYSTKI
ncbi:Spy/CpxP family protein refolding chaperone [Arsukibacterium sp.]|uniref:Spy/CpxP family protein refolding chaperone n=1 Tax=Arsukibacterium sp. TaxID=1977258 RepID=UPI002FD94AEF